MEAHQPWIRYCVQVDAGARWKMANNRNEWWHERSSNLDIVYFVARVVNLTAVPSLSSGFHTHKQLPAKVRAEKRTNEREKME